MSEKGFVPTPAPPTTDGWLSLGFRWEPAPGSLLCCCLSICERGPWHHWGHGSVGPAPSLGAGRASCHLLSQGQEVLALKSGKRLPQLQEAHSWDCFSVWFLPFSPKVCTSVSQVLELLNRSPFLSCSLTFSFFLAV